MTPFLTPRHRILIAIAPMLLALLWLPGCEGFREATGQPTQKQVAESERRYEEAEKALARAKADAEALAAAAAKAADAEAAIARQEETLGAVQAQLATQIAGATPDARPFLVEQFNALVQQAARLRDAKAASAAAVADAQRAAASAAAAVEGLAADLDRQASAVVELERRAQASVAAAGEGIRAVGQAVGQFVPGASAVSGSVAELVAGLFGLGAATFGATTLRARRRAAQAETALGELAHGIDRAKLASPQFREAIRNVAAEIKTAMSPATQRVVDELRV